MTGEESAKSQRLLEILLGRSSRKEQLWKLRDDVESFAEFRVRLLTECATQERLSVVSVRWSERLRAWRTHVDDRRVMHDLEALSIKQVEIEKLLKSNEATLLANLRAADGSAKELASLTESAREIRKAIAEFRRRVAELAAGVK